jgi:hypothetical protein
LDLLGPSWIYLDLLGFSELSSLPESYQMPSKKRNSGGKAGVSSPSPNVSSITPYSDVDQVPHFPSGSSTSLQAQGGEETRMKITLPTFSWDKKQDDRLQK